MALSVSVLFCYAHRSRCFSVSNNEMKKKKCLPAADDDDDAAMDAIWMVAL